MRSIRQSARALTLLVVFVSAGCDDSVANTDIDEEVQAQLASLRTLVEPFRTFAAAESAGWNVLVPGCRDNQPVGGMGWHYLRPEFVSDQVDVLEPQVLMYEPQQDGSLTFVGVEYIIPYDVRPASATPPTLLGETFHQNGNDNVWMLHVWIDEHTRDGVFATWNPKVSCQFAR